MKTYDYNFKVVQRENIVHLSLWNSPGLFSRRLVQYAFVVYVIQDYTINGLKLYYRFGYAGLNSWVQSSEFKYHVSELGLLIGDYEPDYPWIVLYQF